MVVEGDQLYIGRYLVTGADAASLYLEVKSKTATEIHCEAMNDASLVGLLTVFHMERNQGGVANKQNQQPLFAEHDTECVQALAREFDIDFLSLSYTRTAKVRPPYLSRSLAFAWWRGTAALTAAAACRTSQRRGRC